eukprot:jgi/Ulvmu1/9907/UM057_0064.1
MPIAATHSAHMVMAVTCHSSTSRLGLQLRSSKARGPPQAAVSPPATVNDGALGKAVWRLYTAQKHGEACQWIPQERIARKGQEGVCHVASRITRLVPELSSSALTAVSLQMAATNVPAHCMPGFYAACVARAQMLVPLCSLQELADLCWAFFRAQVVAPVEFHAGVLNAAQSWANACMSDNQAALVVSRESAHEAANFLFRLHKAGLLPPDCDLSRQMLHIVAAGTKQVLRADHKTARICLTMVHHCQSEDKCKARPCQIACPAVTARCCRTIICMTVSACFLSSESPHTVAGASSVSAGTKRFHSDRIRRSECQLNCGGCRCGWSRFQGCCANAGHRLAFSVRQHPSELIIHKGTGTARLNCCCPCPRKGCEAWTSGKQLLHLQRLICSHYCRLHSICLLQLQAS